MSQEKIRVQYSRLTTGAVQFGDDVYITSPEEFKAEVLDLIDRRVGRDDVADLLITDELGKILLNERYGVPENILAVVTAAFRGAGSSTTV